MAQSTRSSGGRRGGPQHDEIVDVIRFDLVVALQLFGWPGAMGIPDGMLLHSLTRIGDVVPDDRVPDVVLASGREDTGDLLVEVGDYEIAKWPDSVTVMHVSKEHRVTIVNGRRGPFELKARACLGALFELGCPACGGDAAAEHRLRIVAGWLVDAQGDRTLRPHAQALQRLSEVA